MKGPGNLAPCNAAFQLRNTLYVGTVNKLFAGAVPVNPKDEDVSRLLFRLELTTGLNRP